MAVADVVRASDVVTAVTAAARKLSLTTLALAVTGAAVAQVARVRDGVVRAGAPAGRKHPLNLKERVMDFSVDDLLPFCEKCSGRGQMENPALKQNAGSSYGVRVTYASPVDC